MPNKKYRAMSCEVATGCRPEKLVEPESELKPPCFGSGGSLAPGSLVCGRYEVSRYLGRGSVGDVVSAQHLGLATQVALKFLQSEHLTVPGASIQFSEAARRNVTLSSEHIARVYDVDAHAGVPFMAIEALGQHHLRARIEQQQTPDLKAAVDRVLQVCEALATAHGAGIIHGNIKPENIFCVGAETIKVVDFGLCARALGLEPTPSDRAGALVSHVRLAVQPYLAPEQLRDSVAGDARSDIWSLGCLLFELVLGKSPFDRGSLMRTCIAILEENPASLAGEQRDVPDGLWRVIVRCLRKDPEARFSNVAALAQALVRYGSGRFIHYPERCQARLGETGSLPVEPDRAPYCADPGPAVVRSVSLAVTSDTTPARTGTAEVRPQHAQGDVPPVSVARTLVLAPAASPATSTQLHKSGPEAASPSVDGLRWPKVSAMMIITMLSLLVVGAAALGSIAKQPTEQPRLLHLVTPQTRDVGPNEELRTPAIAGEHSTLQPPTAARTHSQRGASR